MATEYPHFQITLDMLNFATDEHIVCFILELNVSLYRHIAKYTYTPFAFCQ